MLKILKNLLLKNWWTGIPKLDMQHQGPYPIIVCSKDDDLLYGKFNFENWLLHEKMCKQWIFVWKYCSPRPETWQMQTTGVNTGV